MRTMDISTVDFERTYKINGQHLEQKMRYILTGKIEKADNIAYNLGTDCLTYQIKSARATICRGRNIREYLSQDKASEYIYITKSEIAYVMSREEYITFAETFGTVTRESTKNGGHEKIRLGHETAKMLQWLIERA